VAAEEEEAVMAAAVVEAAAVEVAAGLVAVAVVAVAVLAVDVAWAVAAPDLSVGAVPDRLAVAAA
jgi:hypothetical protein